MDDGEAYEQGKAQYVRLEGMGGMLVKGALLSEESGYLGKGTTFFIGKFGIGNDDSTSSKSVAIDFPLIGCMSSGIMLQDR